MMKVNKVFPVVLVLLVSLNMGNVYGLCAPSPFEGFWESGSIILSVATACETSCSGVDSIKFVINTTTDGISIDANLTDGFLYVTFLKSTVYIHLHPNDPGKLIFDRLVNGSSVWQRFELEPLTIE